MTRRLLPLLAAAAITLMMPAPANAGITMDFVRLSLPVAYNYWPGGVCNHRVQVLASTNQPASWQAQGADPNAIGLAQVAWVPQRCVIWIKRTQATLQEVCTEVVHEVGHLNGHTHQEGGVMAPQLDIDFTPCKQPRPPASVTPAQTWLIGPWS